MPGPVLVILGPTGAGKSEYALRLAQQLPIELISVDSAQVYRGMDIGTAKPTAAEQAAVPHHLIDIREPEQTYSAGEFRRDCLASIASIAARGRIAVLVGGTMLYYRALFHGIAEMPVADPRLRAEIDARARREGWPALHAELSKSDPQAAARIHMHDAQRIQRGLEVQALGGRGLTAHWREAAASATGGDTDYRVCVLEPQSRAALHAKLELRLDEMLRKGLVEELRALLARGTLTAQSPALRAVGYRQLLAFCDGRESFPEAREKALFATRQLAKRQLTWMRSNALYPTAAQITRFDPFAADSVERFCALALQTFRSQC